MTIRIILLGPPGSGKGTQAELLKNYYNITHINIGNILRSPIKNNINITKKIHHALNNGFLINDNFVLELIKQKITTKQSYNGFIIDGFPRTKNQSILYNNYLKQINIKLSIIIYLDITTNEIFRRLSSRMICPNCNKTYNNTHSYIICPYDNHTLIKRQDDNNMSIQNRIISFKQHINDIKNTLTQKHILININGSMNSIETNKQIKQKIYKTIKNQDI